MGRAYAAAAAAAGAQVVVADIGDAEPVANDIVEAGGSAIAVRLDVSEEASVGAMVRATIGEFGRVDFLVNNAAPYATLGINPFAGPPSTFSGHCHEGAGPGRSLLTSPNSGET